MQVDTLEFVEMPDSLWLVRNGKREYCYKDNQKVDKRTSLLHDYLLCNYLMEIKMQGIDMFLHPVTQEWVNDVAERIGVRFRFENDNKVFVEK